MDSDQTQKDKSAFKLLMDKSTLKQVMDNVAKIVPQLKPKNSRVSKLDHIWRYLEAMDYTGLPESLHRGMKEYVEHGVRPGQFLCAILKNDSVTEAVTRADAGNVIRLYDIVIWCLNTLPSSAWGTPEKFEEWMKERERMRVGTFSFPKKHDVGSESQ